MKEWLGIVNGVREPGVIVPHHCYMLSFTNDSKAKPLKSTNHFLLWRIDREFRHSSSELGFGNKGFEYRRIGLKCFRAKCFYVEIDSRSVVQCLIVSVALPDHDSLKTKWIRNKSVRMAFDNDF